MAGMIFARPLLPEDDELLSPIDGAYAARYDLEPIVSRASITFYSRSGHAFVAMDKGKVTGFGLAHAVWNGNRPTVQVSRLATEDGDDTASLEALLEAVTKSAYDAAVYDIDVLCPSADAPVRQALETKSYQAQPITVWRRVLGSRGQASS